MATLPKYFVQLTDGLRTIAARDEMDFSDTAAAREYVTSSLDAFQRCAGANVAHWPFWSIQVLDEEGKQVFTLRLPPQPA